MKKIIVSFALLLLVACNSGFHAPYGIVKRVSTGEEWDHEVLIYKYTVTVDAIGYDVVFQTNDRFTPGDTVYFNNVKQK